MRVTGVVMSIALLACLAAGQGADRVMGTADAAGECVKAIDRSLAWFSTQQSDEG